MKDYEIVESSPVMMDEEARQAMQAKVKRPRYPFLELEPGQSFTLPYDDNKNIVKSLRVRAKQLSTDGREFSVLVHTDRNLVEVGRVK